MPKVTLSDAVLTKLSEQKREGESLDAMLRRWLAMPASRKGSPRKYPIYDMELGAVAKIPWVPKTEAFMIPDQQRIWQAVRNAKKVTGHTFDIWWKADAVYVKRIA